MGAKVRNFADTPDVDELAALRAWQKEKSAGVWRPPFIVGLVCPQCHGAAGKLAPDVAKTLQQLYPHD